MRRLWLVLIAVLGFTAGCHGYPLADGGVYWLSDGECADGTAHIQLTHTLNPSRMGGTSGAFTADANGCHPYADWPGGYSRVMIGLSKIDAGLCVPGPGWVYSPDGSYAAQIMTSVPFICGEGGYYTWAANWVNLVRSGVVTTLTRSPSDYWN